MQVFFVGGPPKSGTTWVQRALDLHPNVICSGEGHFHEFIVRPMMSMYRSHNKRLEAIAKVVYEGSPLYRETSQAEMIAAVQQTVLSLMSRRTKPGALAVGDKTPDTAIALRDFNIVFPDMLYISVFRDPRDVAASCVHHNLRIRGQSEIAFNDPLYRRWVEHSIRTWNQAYDKTRDFATDHPNKVAQVLYEDFLIDPRAHLLRLFNFLRVPTSDEMISTVAECSSFEAMSGRRSGQEDRRSFLRKGIRGDWVNVLESRAVAEIQASCGEGMSALGYH